MNGKNAIAWIIIIVVAAVAVSVIYLNTLKGNSAIDVSLNVGVNNSLSVYPYQSITFPLNISNYGSTAFEDLGLGIFINGNLTEAYNVTLPEHNSTIINFTEEFKSSGEFNVTFVTDPGKLLNIQNRSRTLTSRTVTVLAAGKPDPAENLPANQLSEKDFYMSGIGYLSVSYFKNTYGINSLELSALPSIDAFYEAMFNLTYNYTHSIYSAEATYKNATAYSIWMQGSLVGNFTAIWAKGLESANKNISVTSGSINGEKASIISLGANTTICSWYSDGWIKNFAYYGAKNCINVLDMNGSSITQGNSIPNMANSSAFANYSSYSYLGTGSGRIAYYSNSIIYEAINPNIVSNYTCFGSISTVDNISYCSTVLIPKSGVIGSDSVVRTSSIIGQKNLSVFALINTSYVVDQIPKNIGMLQGFNISGKSEAFISGINSTCNLNASLSCYSPTLALGNMTLRLYNRLNESVHINTMYCNENGPVKYSDINANVLSLSYYNITVPCYDNGALIQGIPLGLTVHIGANYTVSGVKYTASGSAHLV